MPPYLTSFYLTLTLLTQLILLCTGRNYVALQAFDPEGNSLNHPHDYGYGRVVRIKCTFPSRKDVSNPSVPSKILIFVHKKKTSSTKQIYQAECKQLSGKFDTSVSKKLKYKDVGNSISYDRICNDNSLEYKVKVTADLPEDFQCTYSSGTSYLSTTTFQMPPNSLQLSREPSSPITEGGDVKYICTTTESRPGSILKFTLNGEPTPAGKLVHEPSVAELENQYFQLGIALQTQASASKLVWTVTSTSDMNGKTLKCTATHPVLEANSLAAKVDISLQKIQEVEDGQVETDEPREDDSVAASGSDNSQAAIAAIFGNGDTLLTTPVIATIVVLSVGFVAAMIATLVITFRERPAGAHDAEPQPSRSHWSSSSRISGRSQKSRSRRIR